MQSLTHVFARNKNKQYALIIMFCIFFTTDCFEWSDQAASLLSIVVSKLCLSCLHSGSR